MRNNVGIEVDNLENLGYLENDLKIVLNTELLR